jgi:hypothetical protein
VLIIAAPALSASLPPPHSWSGPVEAPNSAS